jgi:hypothetical protein
MQVPRRVRSSSSVHAPLVFGRAAISGDGRAGLAELAAEAMPPGNQLVADPNAVAEVVLGKSTWAVLALTCHIEIFTLVHYRKSIEADASLSELWRDVFLYH